MNEKCSRKQSLLRRRRRPNLDGNQQRGTILRYPWWRRPSEQGADILVTACPYCILNFKDSVATAELEIKTWKSWIFQSLWRWRVAEVSCRFSARKLAMLTGNLRLAAEGEPENHPENRNIETQTNPSGAVMVVGAGVSGIQAALDAANSGFKVYLVDKGLLPSAEK
jgi:hypothetical protein